VYNVTFHDNILSRRERCKLLTLDQRGSSNFSVHLFIFQFESQIYDFYIYISSSEYILEMSDIVATKILG